jgi:hypothetical protein
MIHHGVLVSKMAPSILPSPPEGSELARWAADGFRREPTHSNIAYFGSPDERFVLVVQVDDPVQGYLVELHLEDADDTDTPPIGRTIVDDRDLAIDVAAHMAAAAEDLEALADRPVLGPETVYREDVERDTTDAPDGWEDEEEWQDALEEAFEKAEISRSKGTLTTKTIDDREYYYLQWREGDSVKSQYVAPVSPAQ